MFGDNIQSLIFNENNAYFVKKSHRKWLQHTLKKNLWRKKLNFGEHMFESESNSKLPDPNKCRILSTGNNLEPDSNLFNTENWLVFLKIFNLGPILTDKTSFANFCVFAKIFAKSVCQRDQPLCWQVVSIVNIYTLTSCQSSQRLRWHCVGAVIDYADKCRNRRWLHGHVVGVVVVYADMASEKSLITRTLSVNFESFSQILKEQSGEKTKKVLWCFYKTVNNNLKTRKCPYPKKKLRVWVVIDYADTRFLNFVIEDLREKEKVCKTLGRIFKQKHMVENLVKLSLKGSRSQNHEAGSGSDAF